MPPTEPPAPEPLATKDQLHEAYQQLIATIIAERDDHLQLADKIAERQGKEAAGSWLKFMIKHTKIRTPDR